MHLIATNWRSLIDCEWTRRRGRGVSHDPPRWVGAPLTRDREQNSTLATRRRSDGRDGTTHLRFQNIRECPFSFLGDEAVLCAHEVRRRGARGVMGGECAGRYPWAGCHRTPTNSERRAAVQQRSSVRQRNGAAAQRGSAATHCAWLALRGGTSARPFRGSRFTDLRARQRPIIDAPRVRESIIAAK